MYYYLDSSRFFCWRKGSKEGWKEEVTMGFSGLQKKCWSFGILQYCNSTKFTSLQNIVKFQYSSDRDCKDHFNKTESCLKPYVGCLTCHESSCEVGYNANHI